VPIVAQQTITETQQHVGGAWVTRKRALRRVWFRSESMASAPATSPLIPPTRDTYVVSSRQGPRSDPDAPAKTAITGWGRRLPTRVVKNEDLAATLDTSDEWIRTRTGICERRVISGDESTASLATGAAIDALAVAGLDPSDVDLIIVCTLTPDHGGMPTVASAVQHTLGASHAGAFDLNAACAGFVYGLSVASALVTVGTHRNVLLIGAETLSRFLDWTDRSTCVLFGDGAGAVVIQRVGPDQSTASATTSILGLVTGADGSRGSALAIPAGGSRTPASHETVDARAHYIQMDGREVYRFAVSTVPEACVQAIRNARLTVDDIDVVILHQANIRIIRAVMETVGIPWDRAVVNLDRYGNTSAASIPIALAEAVEAGRVAAGDRILIAGFGGGLTWGAAVIEWHGSASPAHEAKISLAGA
jgi:3-oxoacyl-[acyl-carrier-protein] synthase-3